MIFRNDPTDTLDDFLPNWEAASTEIDDGDFVAALENGLRDEYAALAEL